MIIEFLYPYERPAKNLVMMSPDFGLQKVKSDIVGTSLTIGNQVFGKISDVVSVDYYYDDYDCVRVTADVELINDRLLKMDFGAAAISFENKSTEWLRVGNTLECSCCHNKIKYSPIDLLPSFCPHCGRRVKFKEN